MKKNYEIKIKLTPKFKIQNIDKVNVIEFNGRYYSATEIEKLKNIDTLNLIYSLYDFNIVESLDKKEIDVVVNNFKEYVKSKEDYADFLFEKTYEALDLGEVENFEIIATVVLDEGNVFKDMKFSFLSEICSASKKYKNLKSLVNFGKSPIVSSYTWAPPGCTKMRCMFVLDS